MRYLAVVIPVLLVGIVMVGCCNRSTSTVSAESDQLQAEQVEVTPGMEQVAIFSVCHLYKDSRGTKNYPGSLQKMVNAWLGSNHGKVEIVRVLQSQGAEFANTVITIFYKKTG